MALTIKSSALTGRIVPFFISSCSDRSSRLIANRKLGNKVLRQISFPHSLVRISLYINKGSSGLAVKRSKCASMKHFIFSKKVGQPLHSKFPQSLDSTGFFIFVKIGSEVHRLFYRIFSNLLFECPTLNFYRQPKISMQSIAAFISSV